MFKKKLVKLGGTVVSVVRLCILGNVILVPYFQIPVCHSS